jgi:hypothetical protein
MFTWICPKCGKEVPPAYSECPNCSGTQPAAASRAAAPAPAATEQKPAAEPTPAPAATPRPAAPAPTRSHKSGILLSLLFAGAFIVIGLTVFVLVRSRSAAPASAAQPQAPQAAPLQPIAPAGAAAQANPAWRHIELAGLRLTEDAKQRAFLQLVLVNHSGGDLGEVNARGNLKAIAGKDLSEVGTFQVKTSLGPYESKELKVPVQTRLRVYELPDWQFLRAELSPP